MASSVHQPASAIGVVEAGAGRGSDSWQQFERWSEMHAEGDRLNNFKLPPRQDAGLDDPQFIAHHAPLHRFVPCSEWIPNNFYDPEKVQEYDGVKDFKNSPKLILDPYQRDILDHVLTPDADDIFPYRTVLWMQLKKHGKTTLAGGVGAWWGEMIEAPNRVFTMASTQEQAVSTIFNAMLPTLEALGAKVPKSDNAKPYIRCRNGTAIRSLANNYKGSAGKNYGLTLWSELWTYMLENDRRLFDEMPPVMTRKNSMRWIETYAGFEDQSKLLLELFTKIFTNTRETQLQPGVEVIPELAHITTDGGRPTCFRKGQIFAFIDHDVRASWMQGKRGIEYIESERETQRHSTFVRFWENRWQASEGGFIEPALWDAAVTLPGERSVPMFLAGDASESHDTTALVGVERVVVNILGQPQERYRVVHVRVWDPEGKDIDLDETIAKEVERLYRAGLMIGPFHYDRYQMHQVAVNLRKKGIPCKKFDQVSLRRQADTFLWQLFRAGKLDVYSNPILEEHVKAAKAKEYEGEQIRIIKGTVSEAMHVDAAVALSMATFQASVWKRPKPQIVTTSSGMFDRDEER